MTTAATETVLFAWSSGKDSALALYELRQSDRWEVTALLTTVTEGYERVSMHGVREALLDEQAAAMGLALHKVRIPIGSSMDEYETRMRAMLEQFAAEDTRGIVPQRVGERLAGCRVPPGHFADDLPGCQEVGGRVAGQFGAERVPQRCGSD